jgi:hypothetical protein
LELQSLNGNKVLIVNVNVNDFNLIEEVNLTPFVKYVNVFGDDDRHKNDYSRISQKVTQSLKNLFENGEE